MAFLRYVMSVEDENRKTLLAAQAAITAYLTSLLGDNGTLDVAIMPQFRNAVRGELRIMSRVIGDRTTKGLAQAAEYGELTMRDVLLKQVGPQKFSKLAQGTSSINTLVAKRAEQNGAQGEPIHERIERIVLAAQAAITSYVMQGALRGLRIQEVTKRVRQAFTGETLGGRKPPITAIYPNVARAVRTEYAAVYGDAQKEYAKKTKAFAGFKWTLSAAHPRRDICDLYAGTIFQPDDPELAVYPPHANCWCVLSPIVK